MLRSLGRVSLYSRLPACLSIWTALAQVNSLASQSPQLLNPASSLQYAMLATNRSTMDMPTLPLKDGNSVPMLAFGTGTAWYKDGGKGPFDDKLVVIIKEAIELGFRHIDCADAYGTEEEVGVAIRESKVPRDELFITTKVQDNVFNIPAAIEASLKSMQLDYVDLYMIHSPYFAKNDEDLQTAWKGMEAVQKSGKTKSIGVSNYLPPHLKATLQTAITPPVVNQIEFQPYLQRANSYVPWMQEHGIEVEAFKGLAPLTKGKGGPLDKPLEAIAKAHGVTPGAILLRWNLQQNIIAITTTRKSERLKEYMEATKFQLSNAEMEEITQTGLSHHFRAAQQKKFDIHDRT